MHVYGETMKLFIHAAFARDKVIIVDTALRAHLKFDYVDAAKVHVLQRQ